VGHQDSDLELRAMFAEAQEQKAPIDKLEVPEDSTPLTIDHDFVRSWRETARFFRKAA
jgi:hypothetical protein